MGRHLFRKLVDIPAAEVDKQRLLVKYLKQSRISFKTRPVPPNSYRYSVETAGLCCALSAVEAGVLELGRPVDLKLRFNGLVLLLTAGRDTQKVFFQRGQAQTYTDDSDVDVIVSVNPGDTKVLYDRRKDGS